MVNPRGYLYDLAQIPNGGCNLNCCIKIFDTPMSSIGPTPISTIVRKLFEPWVQTKRKIPYLFVKYIFIPEIYTQQIIKKSFLCLSPRRAIKRKMYVILFIFKVCIHTLNKHLKISKKSFFFTRNFSLLVTAVLFHSGNSSSSRHFALGILSIFIFHPGL